MAFQRGDIVLIPFPYTDLSASKTRPALVISSATYHDIRSEILLAYISSQVSKAHSDLDYVLLDWSSAGLPKPSFMRPKLAAIEANMVVHQVGRLSERDQIEVDHRLRQALGLTAITLEDLLVELDLTKQSAKTIQTLAEKSIVAIVSLAHINQSDVNIEQLQKLITKTSAES